MPSGKYLKLLIDRQQVDIASVEDIDLPISYRWEDPLDFQSKKSSDVPSITVPATTVNDIIANTFRNPAVEDLTPDQSFRSFRQAIIEANGYELLVGKALITNAKHTDVPVSYEYAMFGTNADWLIDLREATLFDFLKHITFTFSKDNIEDSWAFDGTDEALPYVFAPVRYGAQMETGDNEVYDYNMLPTYMRPALSVYWLIYWGFKSLGYKITSDFFQTAYFRRQVMPWTWGNFLTSDGTRLDNLDFLAKSTQDFFYGYQDYDQVIELDPSNDSNNGGFDNNGVYSYNSGTKRMKWEYLNTFSYGALEANLRLQVNVNSTVTQNSNIELRAHWYKNGVLVRDVIIHTLDSSAGIGTKREFVGMVEDTLAILVVPTDEIEVEIYLHIFDSSLGIGKITLSVFAFELDFFRIPLGGTIDFQNYSSLKNYKFLDFLAGILDTFNISPQTDTINKVILLEPQYPYSLTSNLAITSGGYLKGDVLNWNEKQDLTDVSTLPLFSDSERELIFKFKDDANDGLLKKVQDRNSLTLAQGKYAFTDRFKTGKKEITNRFFSPVIHAELNQWRGFGSDADAAPQIVCLVPENRSNTSRDEAQNTFGPKLCYYKGLVAHVGWFFDGEELDEYPFMFAVNYQEGGEDDPILSYADERIGPDGSAVVGKGLLRRFFLQRMAILRNGQYYQTYFKLNNLDVTNWFHREHIICRGQRWELLEINNYRPLSESSTPCTLRKWAPVSTTDAANVFPSNTTVLATAPVTGDFDIKYNPLKCLSSDIPVITE